MTDYTITGQELSDITVTRDSATLSALDGSADQTVELTLTFTPATTIISGNYLKVTIPSDAAVYTGSVGCETGSGTTLTCTPDDSVANELTVEVLSPCGSSSCTGGSEAEVVITGLANPGAIPLTETAFGFSSFTEIDGTDYTTDTFSGSVTVSSVALTPNALSDITISRDDGGVTAATGGDVTWTFTARLATAVTDSSTAGLRIEFPADFSILPDTQAATSDGDSVTGDYEEDADDSTEISYVDVFACEEAECETTGGGDLLTVTVAAKNWYHNGTPDSSLFTFKAFQDGAYFDEGSLAADSFTVDPHAFDSTPTASSSDTLVVGGTVAMTFTVTPFNRLPSSGDNGSLTVTLPSEMSAASCDCDASDDNGNTLACGFASDKFTITSTDEISSGVEITIETSDCVTLPPTGAPTSAGFAFATFSGTAEIDAEESDPFQADTANAITSATVARVNDAATTEEAVEYRITLTMTNPLPSGANDGLIRVYVPT